MACLTLEKERKSRDGKDYSMGQVAVVDLSDPKNWNRWVIGTPPQVPKSSPFYSEQMQVAYDHFRTQKEKDWHLAKEREHSHKTPIEERYLVLKGTLTVQVEKEKIILKPMQILCVPPEKSHRVIDYSLPTQIIVIRTPISTNETKNVSH
jgi:mannose-6-phosphate isomerase-like protein (cupin superfamily)